MILPCQRQSPGLDPMFRVVVSWGTKPDVVSPLIVRKDPLHPFVELLGKRRQVPGGVEFGLSQLLCLWAEQ